MFTDDARCRAMNQVHPLGLGEFARLLTPEVLTLAERAVKHVRRGPLSLASLTWLGVAAAMHTTKNFTGVLVFTCRLLNDAPSCWLAKQPKTKRPRGGGKKHSKHDPRGGRPDCVSEEAFAKARQSLPWEYWLALIFLLADRFAEAHDDRLRWRGLRLLALDGTLVNLPAQKALQQHYGVARNQCGGRVPQARLVMLEFALTRVPCRLQLTPKHCAEKTAAPHVLQNLRRNDLVLMDRGFWSYGLFCQMAAQQAYFAIRQIQQAHLPVIKKLGPGDTLVRFAPAEKKWRRAGLPAEMALRRIEYQVAGFRKTAVITNATDPRQISRADWVGQASGQAGVAVLDKTLYHRRWEIETLFCELKVRQGMARSLRSRTAEGIAFEVAGHVVLYLLTRWLMYEAAEAHGIPPLRLSFTQALREINDIRYALLLATPQRVRRVLLVRLLWRIAQHLVPLRPGRHYPRPADRYRKKKYRQKAKLVTKQT